MSAAVLTALVLGVPVSVFGGPGAPGEGSVVLEGEHVRLDCHFQAPEVAERALEVAETAWRVARALYGVEARAERLFEVNLYRHEWDYAEAEQQLTQGTFRQNLAFSHWNSQTAHVALQPHLSDEALARIGLNYQTARLIAHETAHLARYEAMPNYRYHPGWFADGNASWVETQVLKELGFLEDLETDPFFSTEIQHVQGLLLLETMPTVEELLLDEVELEFHQRYALRWVLFDMLHTLHRERLSRVMTEVRGLGGGMKLPARVYTTLVAALGESYGTLDADLARHVEGLRPRWRETCRSMEVRGNEWIQAAYGNIAHAWHLVPAASDGFTLAGQVTVLPNRNEAAVLCLGMEDAGLVQVMLSAEWLSVTRSPPTMLGQTQVTGAEVGSPISFRISYDESVLKVRVNENTTLEFEDLDLTGTWGVGAYAFSTVIWRDVRVEE